MQEVLYDRIEVTSTTTGLGAFVLLGATPGNRPFSIVPDGDSIPYCITNNIDYEMGIGTVSAGGSILSRDKILSSTNSNAIVNWPAGTKEVFLTATSDLLTQINVESTLITREMISGGRAVNVNTSGLAQIAMAGDPARMPAIGVMIDNTLSGQPARIYTRSHLYSDKFNYSGYIGSELWVGTSGEIVASGGISGNVQQILGVAIAQSGIYLSPSFNAGGSASSTFTLTSGIITSGFIGDNAVNSGNISSGQVGQFHLASGAVNSGHISSGAVQGFFGSTRHIASGTIGVFDFGSGAVIAGAVGSGAIVSGNIASGQVGNFHISSGAVTSGRLGVTGTPDGTKFLRDDFTWSTPTVASGAIQSGMIASGAIQGFFGSTRNIASGTVGVFDFGSGAVIAGTVGSGAIVSGNIASGQVGNFHISSGAVTSGRLGVAGTPDGSKFLRDDFVWATPTAAGVTSGGIQSGMIASGAVQGFFGSTRHIASGTVGVFDFGSGAVIAGTVGSGAIVSGNIASGQIGQFHLASGAVNSGHIGNNAVVSGSVASGQLSTYHFGSGATVTRAQFVSPFVSGTPWTVITEETISGVRAVSLSQSGTLRIAMAGDPATGPAIGIVVDNVLSGIQANVYTVGPLQFTSGLGDYSGYLGQPLYVGRSGQIVTSSGSFNSGGFLSGDMFQQIGVAWTSGGALIGVNDPVISGGVPALTSGLVQSGNIGSGAVQGFFGSTRNIASGTVGVFDFGSGAVIAGTVGSGAIVSGNIASGQVGNFAISSGAVTSGRLGVTGTPDGTKFLRDDFTWSNPIISGSIQSGMIASGAVQGFFGTTRNIASGTVGVFDFGSGAVIAGTVGSGAIISGNIGSGQVGNFHISSGAVTSGRLGVAGTPDGSKFLRDDFTWATPTAAGVTSGGIQSGMIASGAVQGFFGSTRHIASGTVGVFDFGSGAVIAGAVGSGAIVSGNIASGQVGNFAIASGAVTSGRLGVTGTPDGTKFLRDDFTWSSPIISGSIQSGNIASGAVQGFFGSTRNIASGTVGVFDFGSGAVIAGTVGSGAIVSGNIASGQIGQFHLASGAVNSGHIGNNAVVSGSIASGQINTYHFGSGATVTRAQFVAPFVSGTSWTVITEEIISGVRAVALSQSGTLRVAMASISGRSPAIGIVVDNVLSGIQANVYTVGPLQFTSGLGDYSGYIGQPLYVGRSGQIVTSSGSFNSGGFLSGDMFQQIGFAWTSGGALIEVNAPFVSGGVPSLTSGIVQSGNIGSGAVQGFFGTTRNIASGTVGVFDFGSGAVIAGTVGSGAIVSGNIASGQIGQFHLASGSVTSGAIASGQVGSFQLSSGSVTSGRIASGSVGQFALASGAANSGHIASGAIQGFFGSTRHIASGTVGVFDFGSGAVIAGAVGSGAIVSGNIASGQVGNFAISSGAVTSGRLGVTGTPDGTKFLRDDFTWSSPIISGSIQSGMIASGAVQGFFGTTRNIASGTVGVFDFGSGAVIAGTVGSGAIVSGNIASGQIGQFHLASGAVNSGHIGNNAVVSGSVASGQLSTYHLASGATITRAQFVAPFVSGTSWTVITEEIISGVRAVALSQSGTLRVAMASVSGRSPAIGIVVDNVLSGIQANVYTVGPLQFTSGLGDYSGYLGQPLYVGRSGQVVTSSGSFNSGGLLSGDVTQQIGFAWTSGGALIEVNAPFVSGGVPALTSGLVQSGNIASGAVQGFFGSTRNIASGTVGVFDFGSGAVIAGTVGSGAIVSGNVASGQIGQFHLASGAVNSGHIGNNAVVSGSIASGQVGQFAHSSGAINSGHVSSGAIQGFFGSTRHIASGTVGVFDFGSGAVIAGTVGSGAIVSGNIASGQVGNFAISSGAVTSGRLGVTGTPDGTKFLRDDFTWSSPIISGSIQSGMIASGAVQGFFGSTRNIASGTIGVFDFGSGAVIAGTVGSGAIVSGNIASGQIGQFHLASGAVNSGHIGNNAVVSGSVASGQLSTYHFGSGATITRAQFVAPFVSGTSWTVTTEETISGVRAVALSQSGTLRVAMASISGRNNAIGIVVDNVLSGIQANVYTVGPLQFTSGLGDYSGYLGQPLYVGRSGQIVTSSGSFNSGGFLSGDITQQIGFAWTSGGALIEVNAPFVSGGVPALTSGLVQSGNIASGAVQGFFGTTRNIASGTVGVFDFGSGAVIAGTVGSGAIVSGNIASGQIGQFHLASGAVNSGHIGNNAVVSGSIASGQVGQFAHSSGAINSGHIASGAVQGFFGSTRHIASGTIGVFDFGSGAVIAGTVGSGAIVSGNIGSGQVGNFHISSGAVTSGRLGVTGTPDGSKFLRDDFVWATPTAAGVTSGGIQSGMIASGAVQGFFGSTRHIASGTVGVFDFGSGAVIAGTVGSGAIVSGNIASGQIGQFHLASGSVTSGVIASGQVGQFALSSGSVTSGAISSGQVNTYHFGSGATTTRTQFVAPFVSGTAWTAITEELISGVRAVAFSQSGNLRIAMASVSGRGPAIGIVIDNVASGIQANVYTVGAVQFTSGLSDYSGYIGQPLYVGRSGQIVTASGSFNSGGFLSGEMLQQVGVAWTSGGALIGVNDPIISGSVPALTSGLVQSGNIASGAVQGFFGSTRNIASGTVGVFDFGSGAVIAGTVGSGAIVSGNIASGQIGQFHLASGAVNSGHIGNNAVVSGSIASGQVGQFAHSSGAINSGHIASGAVQGFFGSTRNIASGTIGVFDFGSGAVIAGTVGSGAIVSGNIGSGQVGNFAISSGAVTSGRLGVTGTPDGTKFLRDDFTWSSPIISGSIQSGMIASGAVQGFFGSTRNIASGTVGVFDFGSGAVIAGTVGSGAIVSGNIASGQIGQFHLASGAVNSGHIGNNAVVSGSVASGQLSTYHFGSGATITRAQFVAPFVSGTNWTVITEEIISGVRAVALSQSGTLRVAMASISGRNNAIGIVVDNVLSGLQANVYTVGPLQFTSGLSDYSGYIGQPLYVGRSGQIVTSSGSFNSGGLLSGDATQQIGFAWTSGGALIEVNAPFVSGGVPSLTSGIVQSGNIGSGAVQGFFGSTRNIASGTVGVFDFGSGAVIAGTVGSGAIVSGNIASGQIGAFHLGSGAVTSGAIASGQVGQFHLSSGSVTSGAIASGQVGQFALSSGAINSGHISSGAVQGFFGSTRHIASGTIGVFDFGSGAVIAGTVGSGAIVSGNIASGQVGNFAISSGAVTSGRLGVTGTPDGTKFLRDDFTWSSPIISGSIQSGMIASGAVQGFFGSTRNIASGTVGVFDFGSGAVIAGTVGSGAIVSGNIASGQIGQFHLASGAVNSGHIGNNAVVSGSVASGQLSTYHFGSGATITRAQFVAPFVSGTSWTVITEEIISGVRAVALSQSGTLRVAMASVSGRTPAIGIVVDNVLSGLQANVYTVGPLQFTSGLGDYSGYIGQPLYVGRSGQIVTASGSFNSGGLLSGDMTQQIGYAWTSGGALIEVNAPFVSGGVPALTSGIVQSGNIASGAVQGFFGSTRNIASGTVGVFDFGSGAVIAGTVGSGAIVSGNIASGQIGQFHIASGAVTSGAIASGQVGQFAHSSGAINSGHVSSGAIQGFFGATRHIASGTIGVFDFGSGAVIAGTVGSGAIVSGNIGSGQVGNFAISSGAVTSGRLGVTGTPDGTKFLRDDFTWSSPIISGSIQSGMIASGAVQGFFGSTRNIASGTVGVFDFGSGAVIAGTVGSGAIVSGNIASGQIGQFHLASGAVNSGHIGNNAVVSGSVASGQLSTYHFASGATITRAQFVAPFVSGTNWTVITEEIISGVRAVALSQSGTLRVAMASISGRNTAIGIVVDNVLSGLQANVYTVGPLQFTSGLSDYSGYIGQPLYVGRSGQIVTSSGSFNSGGLLSGDATQQIGFAWTSGGALIEVNAPFVSGGVPTLTSGIVQSGNIGSGAVQGFFGSTRNIASGTIGVFDFGSGAVIAGTVGSGAIVSGNIASGQIGQFHLASGSVTSGAISSGVVGQFALSSGSVTSGAISSGQVSQFKLASGAVNSGHVGSGAVQGFFGSTRNIASGTIGVFDFGSGAVIAGTVGSGAIVSGNVASGQIADFHFASGAKINVAGWITDTALVAGTPISGSCAVSVDASGHLIQSNPTLSGQFPIYGIADGALASGATGIIRLMGPFMSPEFNFSGSIGRVLYVGLSGQITPTMPSLSGVFTQKVGIATSHSGMLVRIDNQFIQIGL